MSEEQPDTMSEEQPPSNDKSPEHTLSLMLLIGKLQSQKTNYLNIHVGDTHMCIPIALCVIWPLDVTFF